MALASLAPPTCGHRTPVGVSRPHLIFDNFMNRETSLNFPEKWSHFY